eukprot:Transcript_23139.p2 GENE.Transcript_23139~~Transcript_23139.p2  ORF type:complete len:211 (-),score=93.01 Transcript_23139:169-801(-)
MLDVAEASLRSTVADLQLRGSILRKPRAVGLIPGGREGKMQQPSGSGSTSFSREALDEAVLRLQEELRATCDELNAAAAAGDGAAAPPFCAFNGGNDVWADIGNKRVGVTGLSKLLELPAESVLHVGDQFLNTGNDYEARHSCPCLWIVNPVETKQVLKHILRDALLLPDDALKEGKEPPSAPSSPPVAPACNLGAGPDAQPLPVPLNGQ